MPHSANYHGRSPGRAGPLAGAGRPRHAAGSGTKAHTKRCQTVPASVNRSVSPRNSSTNSSTLEPASSSIDVRLPRFRSVLCRSGVTRGHSFSGCLTGCTNHPGTRSPSSFFSDGSSGLLFDRQSVRRNRHVHVSASFQCKHRGCRLHRAARGNQAGKRPLRRARTPLCGSIPPSPFPPYS